jgi:hypothetical protein
MLKLQLKLMRLKLLVPLGRRMERLKEKESSNSENLKLQPAALPIS